MEITALILLVIFSAVGFAFIFFTNFGTFIILIGIIAYAALTGFDTITIPVLVILITLYLCGEVFEYLFIALGAKKFGASNKAAIGALAGGIIGALFGSLFFGIGLIPGTFLGIFFGAFIVELYLKKDIIQSVKAGAGGVIGRIGAIAAKVIIALVMFIILIVRIISHGGHQ